MCLFICLCVYVFKMVRRPSRGEKGTFVGWVFVRVSFVDLTAVVVGVVVETSRRSIDGAFFGAICIRFGGFGICLFAGGGRGGFFFFYFFFSFRLTSLKYTNFAAIRVC